MPSNYKTLNPDYDSEDPASSQYIDLDDRFIDDAWILERFVGNNLFAFGYNGDVGVLGLNDRTSRSSPVQVGSLTDWKQIAFGNDRSPGSDFAAAIKTDGTLWTWGRNSNGQLGNGTSGGVSRYSSPIQVGSLTNWKQIACGSTVGYGTCVAIKTDGTMWTWGENTYGTLGLNDRTNRSSPVQVGSLTNWKQAACTYRHMVAITSEGALWTWGINAQGQLGLNSAIASTSSPVQIGSLTNWKMVACSQDWTAAVKTDGTLWSWGHNAYGQLGQNNTTNYSSPVQVGTLTNWDKVSCSSYCAAAIKTDGTLWTWGTNYNVAIYRGGVLGQGDIIHRSSPVQVGSLTNWKQVSCGSHHMAAIKTNGTLWAWGGNYYYTLGGGLGQGDTTSRSSPVQVGSLTNWKQVACGGLATLAITYTEIS